MLQLNDFPSGETNFLIDGPAGHLELLTLSAKNQAKGVAIICHPHPQHQGTMHNKVVHTLSRAFFHKDVHSVRFNYRGVGKSEGEFADSKGEIEDLFAVIAWCQKVLPSSKLWLAGFSFGAYIAANGAIKYPCEQLFSIAPAVTNQPFESLPVLGCPWVIIQPEEDEVIDPKAVYAWTEKQAQIEPQLSLHKIPQSSHFFHGKLVILRNLVEALMVGVA
ncbi:MAG: alpha/beta hydrolase [Proteobacteria bacterium]|nr:alpha/beta hydrolase [Pseudomonadota bacterium]